MVGGTCKILITINARNCTCYKAALNIPVTDARRCKDVAETPRCADRNILGSDCSAKSGDHTDLGARKAIAPIAEGRHTTANLRCLTDLSDFWIKEMLNDGNTCTLVINRNQNLLFNGGMLGSFGSLKVTTRRHRRTPDWSRAQALCSTRSLSRLKSTVALSCIS